MKKIIIYLFFPFYIYGQNVNNYSEKIIVSEFNIRENNSIQIRKSTQILKDSVVISETYWRTVLMPNDPKLFEVLKGYDDYINLAIEAWKDIPDTLNVFNTNEITDSSFYVGNYRLNINNVITNGKVKINSNEKYVFDPNLNQPRTINIPLNVKTNLIKINIDGINYLLIKNDNGKYISTDKSIKFTKLE
jgi:hypothetical protein